MLPLQAFSPDLGRWLEAQATLIPTDRAAPPPQAPRSLGDARVILLGEVHGLEHGQVADFALLRALHAQAGVRSYVGEFDAAQADAFNRLLESGDTARMDAVFRTWRARGLQWANKDFREKLVAIAAWNSTLPESGKIRFLGVDEIQDRPAFCTWLYERMAVAPPSPELGALRKALGDPQGCEQAGPLAQAALSVASGLDPVTVDGIAALAVDASTTDRESRIAANIERQLSRRQGRFYGLWGLFHIVKAEVNGTEPMALQLARRGIGVRSIAMLNLDGEMMMPVQSPGGEIDYASMPYTVDSEDAALINGIEVFAAKARHPLTLFTLNGAGSPLRNADILTRVGGRYGRMQPFAIAIDSAPGGLWADAVLISRDSRATRPIDPVQE